MGEHLPLARNLSSLRLLGTVGEPINGSLDMVSSRDGVIVCPVDTWWQTKPEHDTPLPVPYPRNPVLQLQLSWILADVVDLEGNQSRITAIRRFDTLAWDDADNLRRSRALPPHLLGTHPQRWTVCLLCR